MTEQELIEKLSAAEHASWARWMKYLFSLCILQNDGTLTIPVDRVAWWQKEIDTPYAELTEELKQFDRDEVAHILPIIHDYAPIGLGSLIPLFQDLAQNAYRSILCH